MNTIHCIAYFSAHEVFITQLMSPETGKSAMAELYDRKVLEAAEGRPIVRVCETDGLRFVRCDTDDAYAVLVECEADG